MSYRLTARPQPATCLPQIPSSWSIPPQNLHLIHAISVVRFWFSRSRAMTCDVGDDARYSPHPPCLNYDFKELIALDPENLPSNRAPIPSNRAQTASNPLLISV